jgi:hypothetical protein
MSTTTFSAQVEEDSELVDQFQEYREENSMTSKSEAVRTLLREGLEDEQNSQDPQSAPESESATDTESATQTDHEAPVFNTENLAYVSITFYILFQLLPSSYTTTEPATLIIALTASALIILLPIALMNEAGAFGWLSDQLRTAMLQIRGTN